MIHTPENLRQMISSDLAKYGGTDVTLLNEFIDKFTRGPEVVSTKQIEALVQALQGLLVLEAPSSLDIVPSTGNDSFMHTGNTPPAHERPHQKRIIWGG